MGQTLRSLLHRAMDALASAEEVDGTNSVKELQAALEAVDLVLQHEDLRPARRLTILQARDEIEELLLRRTSYLH